MNNVNNNITEKLKPALNSLAKASGLNLCMLDIMGNTLIYPANDCALCKFVRSDKEGRDMCIRFAAHAVLDAAREKKTFFYKCPFGLIDFAVPVFENEKFVGAICGGQVRSQESVAHLDFIYPSITRRDAGDKYDEIMRLYSRMQDISADRVTETARLAELLAKEIDNATPDPTAGQGHDKENDPKWEKRKLQPAINYIENNFTNHISAKEMAELCFISENYFSRLFGKLTGTTLPK